MYGQLNSIPYTLEKVRAEYEKEWLNREAIPILW